MNIATVLEHVYQQLSCVGAYPRPRRPCLQGPNGGAAFLSLQQGKGQKGFHLLPLQKPKWGPIVRFSIPQKIRAKIDLGQTLFYSSVVRKPEGDAACDGKIGGAETLDAGSSSTAYDGNPYKKSKSCFGQCPYTCKFSLRLIFPETWGWYR